MAKKQKLPADNSKRAKSIVDIATGENTDRQIDPIKAAAAALGRKGGLKGGVARAKALSPKKLPLQGGRKNELCGFAN